jgi:HD-GYP domain-containing protein (c-di-GMP phosphodiesterase class II)
VGLHARGYPAASSPPCAALTSRRPFREACDSEVVLMLMWTKMRNKFDPVLLQVFIRVMAIQPVKVLSLRQQTVTRSRL